MSTKLTSRGTPMAESQSLRLVQAAGAVQDRITAHAARILADRGYDHVSASMLGFLGALDCGVNYGSEIARRLGVSRQMVAKTVHELCRVGYLEQAEGPGRQKQILFTATGEQLMSDVRQLLAELDGFLAKRIGWQALEGTATELERIQGCLEMAVDE